MILNGFYKFKNERELELYSFPGCITPLCISMHFTKRSGVYIEKSKKMRDYLLKNGPIGCRDTSTKDFLESLNIPAYFSGCLTLTLQRNSTIPKQNYILAVDIPPEMEKEIRNRTNIPVYSISATNPPYFSNMENYVLAQLFLNALMGSHCVVSKNKHTLYPCLAYGTPALRLKSIKENGRMLKVFTGSESWLHSVSMEKFMQDKNCYDFNNPPPNPTDFIPYRDALIQKVSAFTGFDKQIDRPDVCGEGSHDNLVFMGLMKPYKWNGYGHPLKYQKVLYSPYIKPTDLLKAFFEKTLFKKKISDLEY